MPYYPPTFDEDDSMWVPAAAIPNATGTVNGTTYDGPTATAITNTMNAVNAMLVALRAANIIAED